MNTILLWLTGLLILVLAALFAVPSFVDWNAYRSVFEAQATKLVGRTVTVEGNVSLRLLPAPYVSFEKVVVAGAPASDTNAAPLLKIDDYTLWLSVPPLLQGEIEAQAMEIGNPKLRLALGADGTGNWSGIGGGDFELPFVPRNVAFNAMNIRDGEIEVVDANGTQLVNIAPLSGTLSARALKGPYKFSGEIGGKTGRRELRWSTGRLDENGAIRIKGTVKDAASGMTFAADGLLQKLTTKPIFTGGVAGKLKKKDAVGFEMKTDVFMNTSGAQLSDITILIDSDGRPQIVNGSGRADWQNGAVADLTLNSRWIDVDRLIPSTTGRPLFDRMDDALAFLHGLKLGNIATTTTFEAAQMNLGGELVDAVALKLAQAGDKTQIETLTANLPGNALLDVTGKITKPATAFAGETPSFKGRLKLRGRSLSRFAKWVNGDLVKMATAADGAFSLDSAVTHAPDTAALQEMRGTMAGTAFTGRIWQDRTTGGGLSLALNSAAADLTPIFPDTGALGDFLHTWAVPAPGKAQDGSTDARARPRITNVNLALGHVKIGDTSFADIVVDIAEDPSTGDPQGTAGLTIRNARFVSASGLSVVIDGHTARRDETAVGEIRFVVRAPSAEAMDEMVHLAGSGLAASYRKAAARVSVPMHMAGSLRFGQADDPALQLRFDGTLAGNQTKGRAVISGESEDMRERLWNIATDISLENTAATLKQVGFAVHVNGDAASPVQGRLIAYAIGTPNHGLKATLGLKSEQFDATFEGNVAVAESAELRLKGKIWGEAGNSSVLPALIGAETGDAETGKDGAIRATFSSDLVQQDKSTTFDNVRIALGSSAITGRAVLHASADQRRLEINVDADRLSLPGLFGLAAGTSASRPEDEHVWSDTPFDFSSLDALAVDGKIRVGRLRIGGDARMTDAILDFSASSERITLTSLEAGASNGRVSLNGVLERQPAGASLQLAGRGADIDLSQLHQTPDEDGDEGTQSPSQGALNFTFDLKGRGLSPRGIASVLTGRGEIQADALQLPRFSPQMVHDVAADIADEDVEIQADDLKSRLAGRLADRPLRLGPRKIGFRIRDGALQTDDVTVRTNAATIKATTFVDLGRLKLDSEWRITPNAATGGNALPPVTVFYAGDVLKLSDISPRFGVAALERELAVRRLEGNIDRLEGVRSLRIKKRKKDQSGQIVPRQVGSVRPTIGETVKPDVTPGPDTIPVPAQVRRARKPARKPATGLWDLNEEQPPVELRLQTPEGANPT